MKQKQIENLYQNFSAPLIDISQTSEQKNKAIIISKVLWVLLITVHDTQDELFAELSKIIPDQDAVIGVGSVYFHKMKANLTTKEIKNIRKHYSDTKNFDQLGEWVDDAGNHLH
jgi:hypothetical protein